MTASRQKMIDLSHLALLDSGDLSELPLFDEGQLDSFHDDLKKASGPEFPACGSLSLDLGDVFSREMESEWLRGFNLPDLPDVEMSIALDTLLEGCNLPTQAEEALSPGKPSPPYEAVSYEYEAVSYEDVKDASFHHQGGQDSALLVEEVESYLSEPSPPSPDDSLSLQSIPAQEAFSPAAVVPLPAATQIVLVTPLSPPDSLAEAPAPSSSRHSSELMELLCSPGEPKLTRSRPTPYSRPGRKAKAVVKEEVDEEDSCYPITKKDKKKIQNKNAAIRYRQKKKMEGEAIKQELDELQDVNDELTGKVRGLQHEISYVKDLAKDVFERKGISFDIESYLRHKMAEKS